ncbi:long-chain fatty alcohol dehydrogenase [Sodiomyces alkalinus F11]|uniref:Long-chain fatty alcohol dehydrogenase n=1 Tax=Sodiomyces alkalinus (strain CBS 110278 / VKM F-3762 / F11) TaxID=1314773 RepID=A0A3N2PMV8_SODAK|nr:long-chain fatty alcohol dehydrogenase [Sodiomyces alkalinus F11]ROT35862.1 long-chain fatty alcohol dehydrogenase [Sodiomyces alkalinus F11]
MTGPDVASTSSSMPSQAAPSALQSPPLSEPSFWNETQWAVLWSLMEAILPSIRSESDVSDENSQVKLPDAEYSEAIRLARAAMDAGAPPEDRFKDYLEFCPVQDARFRADVIQSLSMVSSTARDAMGRALSSLGTRLGGLLLTGYFAAVHHQPIHIREAILKAWTASRLTSLRVLCKSLTTLAHKASLVTNPLLRELIDYTDTPEHHRPAEGFNFRFEQPHPATDDGPASVETDIVIVGSGCGGAVCAKSLAEAGHRVLVVDKGYHFPPSQLPMSQEDGCRHLYENGGFLTSDDSSLNLVAGACWGGGGTVNWSVALQTQGFVREEWAREHGLPFFTSAQFQASLDKVCAQMGVGTDAIRHNHRNRVLLEGSRKLGWHAAAAPQNTGGEEHYCGRCHLGCASEAKKGTVVRWLPAAAGAGAKFMEGLEVDKITFDDETDGTKRATGVVGRWVSRDADGGLAWPEDQRVVRDVVIKAKRVIVAGGALCSPLLLLRSGLTNRHIGQNLRVHPCNMVGAYWKEPTIPWEGGIITSYCSSFENLDNSGHGVKLEPVCGMPYVSLANMPWRGGLESKLSSLKFRHFGGFISLTRDRDSGSVYPDEVTGRPRVAYTTSAFDRAHTLEGVIALAKICYIESAVEIHALLPGVQPFVREEADEGDEPGLDGINNPRFTAWLDSVRRAGNLPPAAAFSSAHQMGTCRMAANEDEGVVDSRGRVFGVEGLYVADSSVFPSATGVNPMVTVMAIADWIAAGIAEDLSALST